MPDVDCKRGKVPSYYYRGKYTLAAPVTTIVDWDRLTCH